MSIPELYKKYHTDKAYSSIGLFRALRENFSPAKVFYPGSHVHITPSLIFDNVTYADLFKNTHKFFTDNETINFINKNKEYSAQPIIRCYQQDYNRAFIELGKEFDLLISQYAGFVGQAAKAYLKKDGLLVCNNSHGDASMSALDPDFELIAVYNRKTDDKFHISAKNLETYLQAKKNTTVNAAELQQRMRGLSYTKSPSGYIFKKVN